MSDIKDLRLTTKQIEYMKKAKKRWNIKVGGTGSGKTFIDYTYMIPKRISEMRQYHGANVLIGLTASTVRRNIIDPMRAFYGDEYIGNIKQSDQTIRLFGETFYILGADNAASHNKLRGLTIKYAYGDEFIDWHPEVIKMLTTRLRVDAIDKTTGELINISKADLTGNPKNPGHWAKKFIDDNANNIYYQHSTIFDNPTLSYQTIASIMQELSGAAFSRYVLGEWSAEEGQIYALDRDVHIIKDYTKTNWFQNNRTVRVGIDIGGNKSRTTFQATVEIEGEPKYIGQRKLKTLDAIVTVKEKRFAEEKDAEYINTQVLKFIKELRAEGYVIIEIYVDNAEQIIKRGIASHLRQHGVNIPVKNSLKKPIIERIRIYQRLLNTHRYYIDSSCVHTISAFEDAVWSPKTNSNGIDMRLDDGTTNIDTLDAQEYSTEVIHNKLNKDIKGMLENKYVYLDQYTKEGDVE